jgi:hypothetical protein
VLATLVANIGDVPLYGKVGIRGHRFLLFFEQITIPHNKYAALLCFVWITYPAFRKQGRDLSRHKRERDLSHRKQEQGLSLRKRERDLAFRKPSTKFRWQSFFRTSL